MADITIKRNDLMPSVTAVLMNGNAPYQIPVGSTVKFKMRSQQPQGTLIVDSPADIVNGDQGSIKYEWNEGDTAISGDYNIEFELTLPDMKRITFPNSGYRTLEIVPDLG